MPSSLEVLRNLAEAEFSADSNERTLDAIDAVLRLDGNDETWLLRRGECLARLGRHAESLAHFERSLARVPRSAALWMAFAQGNEEAGDAMRAEAAYREAMAQSPDWAMPLAGLLGLLRSEAPQADLDRAQALLGSGALGDADVALLAYPVGRVLDARREPARAFEAWSLANAAREREVGALDRTAFEAGVEAQIAEPVDAPVFPVRKEGRPQLVLVVGMPRSGTTLVEQILDAHPEVVGCGESPFFAELATRHPQASSLDQATIEREAESYFAQLRRLAGNAPRVLIDKAPLNAFHLGHVQRLVPEAKILWCRRDARDVALSIFSENFAKAATFSTSLTAIASCINAQHRLMRHWQAKLALPIFEVQYEALVDDLETHARRMLAFCGLEWSPDCLAFHQSGRVVQTPSRWQVRQPVHRRAAGRWRPYAEFLQPLLDALEAAEDPHGLRST